MLHLLLRDVYTYLYILQLHYSTSAVNICAILSASCVKITMSLCIQVFTNKSACLHITYQKYTFFAYLLGFVVPGAHVFHASPQTVCQTP